MVQTEEAKVVALNAAWLDGGPVMESDIAGSITVSGNVGICSSAIDYYGWQYPTNTYWLSSPAKIRLTLTEVETLRAAAKRNKALKEALRKFTPHIEIEVDFP